MPIDLMRPLESTETILDEAGHERHFVHHGPLLRRVFNPIAVALRTDAVLFVRGRTSGRRLVRWYAGADHSCPAAQRQTISRAEARVTWSGRSSLAVGCHSAASQG